MALVWDKTPIRDIINLFGGRIKSIVTKGGSVYNGVSERDSNEGNTKAVSSNTP